MKNIGLVSEMFNEYNDPDLSYDSSRDGNTEWFKLTFLVDSEFFTVRDGKRHFIEKYNDQLNMVMSDFLNKYQKEFESSFIEEKRFEVLDRTKVIVKDLKETLTREFLVYNKIALFNIDLVGSWQAYKSAGDSDIEKAFYSDISKHVKRVQDNEKRADE
ncbi:hypothetical protein [Apilactobacillus xinyiensis]|uniref:Uncharacterized protein n=1 Tax=Apilactobacillus xinyiensis TaxID=2841032 RepID=A0ABT0I1H7_9LACO|nr:hypothetical protein [Apilactobacillus xinyiensis]MCK8624550.1 hypothetical protein [Apilactobacillus xinyiensis]